MMDRNRLAAGLGIAAGLAALAVALLWSTCGLRGCPDVATLASYVPAEASVIVDRSGEEVGKLYRVHRVIVPLDSLPEHVPAAFVAIEDRRFWSHDGVDWRRVPGALLANVEAGGFEEGFSTITMQLARNLFPEKLPHSERTVVRKVSEMRVAGEIEDRYSKEEILEMYVNQIYFGSGAWGIEAAANEYFGKSAHELTLAEAALLAGLPRAPSRLNPRANRDAALEGRDLVLRRMRDQGLITAAEAESASEAPLELARRRQETEDPAPYFVDAVRQELEAQFGDEIYTGGFTIHTTLDSELQRVAEAELERQLDAIEAGRYGAFRHATYPRPDSARGQPEYLQGAFVAMDPLSGDVLALVGGRDFRDSEFNRALQAERQPGSAFKPFVYAAALRAGYPPTLRLSDQPIRLVLDDGDVWAPRNYDGSYGGALTMREALTASRNLPTIRLAEQVGHGNVADVMHALGIEDPLPRVPSMPLGVIGVTPLELTAAYAAFASLGQRPEPRFVTRVLDSGGNVVWRHPPRSQRVLDPAVAYLVTDLLRGVVDRGTATAVRAVGFRGPAAGKTGTTSEGTDTWFVGYTPEIVATVWIGLDEPANIVHDASGGALAAPVWGRALRRAGRQPERGWSRPAGVIVQTVDAWGNVVPEGCATYGETRREVFLAGTAPAGPCYGGYAMGPDSFGVYGDSLSGPSPEDELTWWNRLRRRIFGDEQLAERPAPDTALAGPADSLPPIGPPDTAATPPTPAAERRPERRPVDQNPELLGRPAPTNRPPPPPRDTSGTGG